MAIPLGVEWYPTYNALRNSRVVILPEPELVETGARRVRVATSRNAGKSSSVTQQPGLPEMKVGLVLITATFWMQAGIKGREKGWSAIRTGAGWRCFRSRVGGRGSRGL